MRNCGPFLNSRLCAYTVVDAAPTEAATTVAGAALVTRSVVSASAPLPGECIRHATTMRIAISATTAAETTDRRISIRNGLGRPMASEHRPLKCDAPAGRLHCTPTRAYSLNHCFSAPGAGFGFRLWR